MPQPNTRRLSLSYGRQGGSSTISSTQELQQRGPVVEVLITLHSLVAQKRSQVGLQIPSIRGMALIDSGASVTVIDADIARKLYLPQSGQIEAVGIGGKALGFTASCCVNVQGLAINLPRVHCYELSKHGPGLAALIGRDVLAHMVFNYDGPKGQCYLELPGAQQPVKGTPRTPATGKKRRRRKRGRK